MWYQKKVSIGQKKANKKPNGKAIKHQVGSTEAISSYTLTGAYQRINRDAINGNITSEIKKLDSQRTGLCDVGVSRLKCSTHN